MMLIKDTEPTDDMHPVRISASRGRNPFALSYRGRATDDFCQVIELGSAYATNTITSVQKDNILWIEREASDRP